MTEKSKRLIPLKDWPKYHPWPTVSALRHYRFNCHKNGFDKCLCKINGRILIDETKFFEWVEEQNDDAGI